MRVCAASWWITVIVTPRARNQRTFAANSKGTRDTITLEPLVASRHGATMKGAPGGQATSANLPSPTHRSMVAAELTAPADSG